MLENELYCKILFQEDGMQTAQWIIGIIDENQWISPINGLVEVKNYNYNKTIGKADIHDIKPLREDEEKVINKNNLCADRSVSMES